jgi:hypothetical protein
MPARTTLPPLAATLTALVFLPGPARADVICQPGGNAALQACLDHPDPVKRLAPGSYTIDPAQPPVTITNPGELVVRALDPSSRPKINCRVALDGRPVTAGNTAFTVVADAAVARVAFEDLAFCGCSSAIAMTATPGGRFEDVVIRGNSVKNSIVAFDLRGLDTATISDNALSDVDVGMQLIGVRPLATYVEVTRNQLRSSPTLPLRTTNIGIFATNLNGLIAHNELLGFGRWVGSAGRAMSLGGRDTQGTFQLDIVDNEIRDSQIGIATGGPAATQPDGSVVRLAQATGSIAGNAIRRSEFHGITAFHGSTGWTMGPNDFRESSWRELFPTFTLESGEKITIWDSEWSGDVLLVGREGHPWLPVVIKGSGSARTTVILKEGQRFAPPDAASSDDNTIIFID